MEKKKLTLIMLIILALAVLLRLINLDKTEGMWNDEYLTWEIASAHFPKEFFEAIMRNCHAPLHYCYLKLWMYFFHDSDISLRLSSLVPGVLSLFVMFFAGRCAAKKTSDTLGLVAAGFCAISAFLIYFSQEVRIYSLLFFLSALNLYAALKTLDDPSKKHCTFFVITSFLLMCDHTIGFVYVFFSSIGVMLFAPKKNKFKKYFLTTLLIALVAFIPIGIFLYNVMFHQQYFSQWWAPFSFAKAGFFFTDLFSPYLVNITNAPPSFWNMVQSQDGTYNFGFIIFALVPLIISLLCAIRGIFVWNRAVKYFLLCIIGVYFTVFAASAFGKIVFLTKYLTEIYPPLILLMALGFVSFKNRGFKISLATVYVVLTLFFILVSEFSPVHLIRTEGQNLPVIALTKLQKKETDRVLFLYYPKERFRKYSPEIAASPYAYSISKYDFLFIKGSDEQMKNTYNNGKETYRELFFSFKNKPLDTFLDKNIFNNIKSGEKFFLVDFSPVSIFSPKAFQNIITSEKRYAETPFLFLVFSYIRNYIVDESQERLSLNDVFRIEDWQIYVFEKT